MTDTTPEPSDLTEALAAGVTRRGVSLAYGEKQTVDGHDFIPVAFVTYGFGGLQRSKQYGDGGGGGGVAIPLGAYVGGPSGLQFRPNTMTALALGILAIKALGLATAMVMKTTR